MPERIKIIAENGKVSYWNVGRLLYIFFIGALVLVAAQAVNELAEAIITKFVPKKNVWAYFIYVLIAIALVLIAVLLACHLTPDLVEHINLSPV